MLVSEKPIDGESVWRWEWLLDAPPKKLWPLVSDTQRVGKAMGFGPWTFRATPDERGGSRRQGSVSAAGVTFEWNEEPYEWVAPREMGVLRTYTRGPLRAIRQHVLLEPRGEGTRLVHVMAVASHGLFGRVIAWREVGQRSFRGLDEVYRGFDAFLKGTVATSFREEKVTLQDGAEALLAKARGRLQELGFDAALLARLDEAIRRGPEREMLRVRPFGLARRWGVDRMTLLRLFLHATKQAVLELSWDLVCPSCKGATETTTELRRLKTEVHCDSCNIKFDAHFDESVEVTFRPSAAVRPLSGADYCVGGPGNTRHLVAQRRLPVGATVDVPLELEPGLYRLRGPRKPGVTELTVKEGGAAELALTTGAFPKDAALAPRATLRLTNAQDFEHVVVVERLAWKEDVATGSVVTCLQEFRDLFSAQVFAPDVQVGVTSIAILFTDLKSSTAMYEKVGDAAAFALVRDHFKLLFEAVGQEQGGLVKTIGDAVMASFPQPVNAVRAALRMHEQIAAFNEHEKPQFPARLKVGLHAGPCIAVNLNDKLDYFGTTVNMAARIQNESEGDDVVLLDAVAKDPEVAALLASVPGKRDEVEVELKGLSGKFTLVRFVPTRGGGAAPAPKISTRFKRTGMFGTPQTPT